MWECKLNYKKIKMLSCKFRYNSDYINFRKISRHNKSIVVQSFQALYFQDAGTECFTFIRCL